MKASLVIVFLLIPFLAQATPQKEKERQSKKDYMATKVLYVAHPTKGNYNKMIKARLDMATEVIKVRKERKQK